MKKNAVLLNAGILSAIAEMGHTETLTLGDCGLPIRGNAKRIDLALKPGVPGFIETLQTVLTDLQVEKAILAEEIRSVSPQMERQILACLGDNVPVEYVPHETFKLLSEGSKAVVRTGEQTSYANIILVAGVPF